MPLMLLFVFYEDAAKKKLSHLVAGGLDLSYTVTLSSGSELCLDGTGKLTW